MSSLLNKLKSLMAARVRGTRQYTREPEQPSDKAEAPGSLPQVTEASSRRVELPEVTEAPQAEHATSGTVTATSPPPSRVEEPRKEKARNGPFEDDRIVDLLRGEES